MIHCPKNQYAPEGEATSDIIQVSSRNNLEPISLQVFADQHDIWGVDFLQWWHKMQTNGYGEDQVYMLLKLFFTFYHTLDTDSMVTFRSGSSKLSTIYNLTISGRPVLRKSREFVLLGGLVFKE